MSHVCVTLLVLKILVGMGLSPPVVVVVICKKVVPLRKEERISVIITELILQFHSSVALRIKFIAINSYKHAMAGYLSWTICSILYCTISIHASVLSTPKTGTTDLNMRYTKTLAMMKHIKTFATGYHDTTLLERTSKEEQAYLLSFATDPTYATLAYATLLKKYQETPVHNYMSYTAYREKMQEEEEHTSKEETEEKTQVFPREQLQIRKDIKRLKFQYFPPSLVYDAAVQSDPNVQDAYNQIDHILQVYYASKGLGTEYGFTQGSHTIASAVYSCSGGDESKTFGIYVGLMKFYGLEQVLAIGQSDAFALRNYQLDWLLNHHFPIIFSSMQKEGMHSGIYATGWFLSLFTGEYTSLGNPLRTLTPFSICRFLDGFMQEGWLYFFRFVLAWFHSMEASFSSKGKGLSSLNLEQFMLLFKNEWIEKLPGSSLQQDTLFESMELMEEYVDQNVLDTLEKQMKAGDTSIEKRGELIIDNWVVV